jgi:pimeloyl-ACP methyl ester carboxylesterase
MLTEPTTAGAGRTLARTARERPRRARPAAILAGSLLAGLAAAATLVAGPFAGDREPIITGALLLGFAVGWALLAVLSVRLTGQPQRWAMVPAAAMGVTGAGLIILAPDAEQLSALAWIWPPLLLALVVWMVVHAPTGRLQRRLLYPVFAVLALAAFGGGYEAVGAATDAAVSQDGSRLVDVGGGRRLAIRCTGSGSPAVVLEPGLGEPASALEGSIAPEVARTTTVCVYDRAGHGHSDAAPAGGADPARDLHTLLERAHVAGPFVLAGHSLGGILALDYARRYSGEVGGVVLLDSMHPHQTSVFAGTDRLLAIVPTLARMGIARPFFDSSEGEPTTQATQLVRDIEEMPAALDRAAKLTTLGDRPLAVITAAVGAQAGWAAQQDDLARLSSTTVHRTVPGATHASLVEAHADAAESSRAIRDIVKAVRARS